MLINVSVDASTIYTIGHGTRSLADLVATLRAAGIARLVDVRRFPASRRNPQFGREILASSLPTSSIEYDFRGDELGGRRRSKTPSRHPALENPGFRAYADYMDELPFHDALARLIDDAKHMGPIAIICAETAWQRCHRRLIADALALQRIPVVHLLSPTRQEPHRLTRGVRADNHGHPVYDVGQSGELFPVA